MRCLFWNTNLKELDKEIVDVVVENEINILGLAEYNRDTTELMKMFIAAGYNIFELQSMESRVKVFTTTLPGDVERIKDKRHYTLFRVNIPNVGKVMFGFIHMFSKWMKDENDYFSKLSRMVSEIERKESEVESDYTILAGDFNMNPYEKGMLAAGGLYAFPTKIEAKKKSRTIDDEVYKMFYNPMWRFFGDDIGVPGTYFTNPTHTYGLHWNIFDQVIYRPELIEHIKEVEIVKQIRGVGLLKSNKDILTSDHLPIMFKFKED